jgi:glycosyltransferase involved in cell wall biosynthesis
MRILFIGKYPPIQGGVASQGFSLIEHLITEGHDVYVISDSLMVESEYRTFLTVDDFYTLVFKDIQTDGNAHFDFIPPLFSDREKIPENNMNDSLLYGRAIRRCENLHFDFIISNYLYPYGFIAGLVSAKYRIPHIVKHAGSDLFYLFNDPDLRSVAMDVITQSRIIITNKLGKKTLERSGLKTKNCLTDIRTESAWPKSYLTTQTDFIEYMIEIAKSSPDDYQHLNRIMEQSEKTSIRLAVCGKAGATKGTFHLIDAVQILVERGFEVCCIAAWSNAQASGVFDYIKECQVEHVFFILPPIPRWRIPALLKYCHATLHLEHSFWLNDHSPQIPLEVIQLGQLGVFSQSVSNYLNKVLPDSFKKNWKVVPEPMSAIELANIISSIDCCEQKSTSDNHNVSPSGYENEDTRSVSQLLQIL